MHGVAGRGGGSFSNSNPILQVSAIPNLSLRSYEMRAGISFLLEGSERFKRFFLWRYICLPDVFCLLPPPAPPTPILKDVLSKIPSYNTESCFLHPYSLAGKPDVLFISNHLKKYEANPNKRSRSWTVSGCSIGYCTFHFVICSLSWVWDKSITCLVYTCSLCV